MSTIGIDPSLTGTGLAYADQTRTVRTDAKTERRLAVIHDTVLQLLPGHTLAVIEDLPTHAHGAGLTGMAQGVIRLACEHTGVPYTTVPAATLKKFATSRGNATKPDMRLELFKRTGLDLRDDNQVDAWWLRQIGLHLTGHPDALTLPQTHTIALTKVKNP